MRCLAPISAAAAELGATELAYARLCTKPSQTHAHLVCHSWLQASPRATQASNSLSPDREYAPTTIANMQDTHATRRGPLCPQLYERGAERPVSSLPDTHSKTGHLLHLIRPRFCLLTLQNYIGSTQDVHPCKKINRTNTSTRPCVVLAERMV